MARLTVTYIDGQRLTTGGVIPAPEFSPEAQLMLDNYTALGVPLEGNELNYMVAYVDALVTAGIYLLMDYDIIFPLAGANALVDWKGGKVATNNGATFDVNGATFAGAGYINGNFNPTNDGVNWKINDGIFGAFLTANNQVGTEIIMGIAGTTSELRADTNTFRMQGTTSNITFGSPYVGGSLYVGTVTDNITQQMYVDGVRVTNQAIPWTPSIGNGEWSIGSRNLGQFIWNGTMATALIGAAINFDQPAYNTILRDLLTGLGTI